MQLHELVAPLLDAERLRSLPDVAVRQVTALSKQVQPGSLFIAVRGAVTDGHAFIAEAITRGAVAVVGEFPDEHAWHLLHRQHPRVPLVRVGDARQALVEVGRRFYDYPATKLQLVGITGTNGKTTTAFLVDHLLRAQGASVGLLGTVAYRCGERYLPSRNTTPGQLELQSLLAQMIRHRSGWCVMEVSSHALVQRRVEGLQFHRAVFTNLGSDHLDYHGSRERYFEAKSRLFTMLQPGGRAVINLDDPSGRRLVERLGSSPAMEAEIMTFALQREAVLRAEACELTWDGTACRLMTPRGVLRVTTRLLGLHNVANVLAAVGCVLTEDSDLDAMRTSLAAFPGVPGRMELMPGGQGIRVVVDYAHTEAALEAALLTVRSLQPRRVLTVFGCGGNRDRTKRPAMGRVAGRLSDVVCVTSDNPREDDPAGIAADVMAGLQGTAAASTVILDRAEAITATLAQAAAGDCVLIAGKGHETYQVLKDTTIPFDDRQVASRWLRDHHRCG